MIPLSSAPWIRSAAIRSILAFVCTLSVMMPTWRPVKERASKPIARNAIASRAIVTRSPVESSIHLPLVGELGDRVRQLDQTIRLAAHGGDYHDDSVARLPGLGNKPRHVLDPV